MLTFPKLSQLDVNRLWPDLARKHRIRIKDLKEWSPAMPPDVFRDTKVVRGFHPLKSLGKGSLLSTRQARRYNVDQDEFAARWGAGGA